MADNKGYLIEKKMMQWFKGVSHPADCVDFQTKRFLCEVKSCRLFIKCFNGNNKRHFLKKPHKKIETTQSGRFSIKLQNHLLLKSTAEKEGKIPRYIFVLEVGKQKVWKVMNWEDVDKVVCKTKKYTMVRQKDIFTEGM